VTSVPVSTVTGWPASYPYTIIVDEGTANEELMEVTNRSGLTLTVTRGADSTAPVAHLSGASAKHGVSAQDFEEMNGFLFGGVGDAWVDYTPTITGFSLGNGTVTGKYLQLGKMVFFRVRMVWGTTSSTGSSAFTCSLPVTAKFSSPSTIRAGAAEGWSYDDSAFNTYHLVSQGPQTTTCAFYMPGTNGFMSTMTSTTPFTWAANDYIVVHGWYEAA
jgi:hypothetical protein